MGRGQRKSSTNKSQSIMASPEPSYPGANSPRHPSINEIQGDDLTSMLTKMITEETNKIRKELEEDKNKQIMAIRKEMEEIKDKEIMAIREEIQEAAAKQSVAFREEMLKSLNEIKETVDWSNKQLKELTEKHENTVRQGKETNKIAQDLKIELEKLKKSQMEEIVERKNLGKKAGTTEASITNRLQEMEERISGVEDTMEEIDVSVKENVKSKKFLTQTVQEIQDNIKRQNLRIIGIEEKEDSLHQGPENIFNKIIEENFPNLKERPIRIQEAYRTPNKLDQKRKSSRHIIIKTVSIQNKEKILKAAREKGQVTYNGKPIRITPDFSTETMKARRAWTDIMQTLREHRCQPRLLYPAKLSVLIDGENKIFSDKNKFQQYLHTNPALQKTLEGKIQPKKTSYIQENTGNK